MTNLPANKELNQLLEFKDRICIYCGRSYPETVLDIQSRLLYNDKYKRVDLVRCRAIRDRQLNLKL
jgi:hypothetical protein